MPNDILLNKLEAWKSKMDTALQSAPSQKYPLPSHRLGCHWIPVSTNYQQHKDYIKALKPAVIKVVNGNKGDLEYCLANLDPGGVLVVRDHARSEQQDFLARDPIACGKQHALEWKKDFGPGGKYDGIPTKNIVVCGLNEPVVFGPTEEKRLLDYTIAFLTDLKSYGLRGMCLNLSVGWPRNSGGATLPIWDTFKPLEKIINDGNHILGLHEYWYSDPDDSWTEINGVKFGWYGHRHQACPLNVPIIIGECGLTRKADMKRWEKEGYPQPAGWINNVSPDAYAEQLWRYAQKCASNVIGALPFTTGFASQDWAEDATDTAHPYIIKRKVGYTFPSSFPYKTGTVTEPQSMSDSKTIIVPKMTGKITGFYGTIYTNKFGTYAHEGVDIGTPVGTPIYAPYDGVIAWSDVDNAAYGEYIRTYHKDLGVCFMFGHLSRRLVNTGDSIKQGQLIGYSGNTGNSSGAHIHVGVRFMEKDSVSYRKNVSAHSKSEVDLFGFIAGWIAAGNKVVEQ